jgi:hypothetical protein
MSARLHERSAQADITFPEPRIHSFAGSRRKGRAHPRWERNQTGRCAYGPESPHVHAASPRPVKHAFRSTFIALCAALAFICAGWGDGARGAHGGQAHPPGWRQHRAAQPLLGERAPTLTFLRGGALVLTAAPRHTGAPPRLGAGTDPSHRSSFAAHLTHRRSAGTRTRRILTLALARHLAAARDGTLSSRSTGVPPPSPA